MANSVSKLQAGAEPGHEPVEILAHAALLVHLVMNAAQPGVAIAFEEDEMRTELGQLPGQDRHDLAGAGVNRVLHEIAGGKAQGLAQKPFVGDADPRLWRGADRIANTAALNRNILDRTPAHDISVDSEFQRVRGPVGQVECHQMRCQKSGMIGQPFL